MTVLKDLVLATNNSKKLKEIREILGDTYTGTIFSAADFPQYPEPEENGLTFQENAHLKAAYYAERTGHITLADDSGLCVDALDGRPGVKSARYAETEALRIEKLLRELKDVPTKQRTARFQCTICVAFPDGNYFTEDGLLEGSIATQPRGDQGFGYDPIFLVEGSDRTLAEIPAEQKNLISHRGQAMKKIRTNLLNALTSK